MTDNLDNISPQDGEAMDNSKLLQYLHDQLNKADSHELEKHMAEDPFMDDAVEGLQQFDKKNNIPGYITQLNKELDKQLKKKNRYKKRRWKDQPLTYLIIILVLILIIVSYIIIKKVSP